MSTRLDAAVAELVDALRAELIDGAAARTDGPPSLLSVADASRRLGVSRNTLHELVRRGELTSCKVRGRRLILPAGVDAFLAAGGSSDPGRGKERL